MIAKILSRDGVPLNRITARIHRDIAINQFIHLQPYKDSQRDGIPPRERHHPPLHEDRQRPHQIAEPDRRHDREMDDRLLESRCFIVLSAAPSTGMRHAEYESTSFRRWG